MSFSTNVNYKENCAIATFASNNVGPSPISTIAQLTSNGQAFGPTAVATVNPGPFNAKQGVITTFGPVTTPADFQVFNNQVLANSLIRLEVVGGSTSTTSLTTTVHNIVAGSFFINITSLGNATTTTAVQVLFSIL